MRKNRLLLCFLFGIAIIFYGVPFLNFQGEMTRVLFSVTWIILALMSIGGNFIALLYGKKVNRNKTIRYTVQEKKKQKVRQYS